MPYKPRGVKYTKPDNHCNSRNPRPLPEKAFRRRKAGRYSVKKSVLFERSEFTGFRNIARLFSFWRLWA